jgi:hypothetical protein
MEISLKAVIATFNKLIRYPAHIVFQPFHVFSFSINRQSSFDAFLILIANSIFSESFMKSYLVVVKDVFLTGTNLRIYPGATLRAMP